ncbi:MAG: acetylglutamate kinase [Dysgonamonadaceae bacterium]|jgi:acetylglutamate kinase|nr:acetylglutamate kinase [Dysgonamonadaceae bacterium]
MELLTVVKVGGGILEDTELLSTFLEKFSMLDGHRILVHGGGVSVTELASRLGISTRMVEGRRVTDSEMLRVVTMVCGGLLNKELVVRLQSVGVNAVGLTGADMNLLLSVRRVAGLVDYGLVGDIRTVNVNALIDLLDRGYVPVLAPLSHDGAGQLLNTNADSVASLASCALALDYRVRLVYCFERSGVMAGGDAGGEVIPELDRETYIRLRDRGLIFGGMIPKLEGAFRALSSGVTEVVVTSAFCLGGGGGTALTLNRGR